MKNYLQPGDTIEVPAPYALASGNGVLIGSMFGVAVTDAAIGAPVQIKTTGVVELPKVGSQAWAVGDPIYWDDAERRTTKSVGAGPLIGAAAESVADGAANTLGNVRLNGVFGVVSKQYVDDAVAG